MAVVPVPHTLSHAQLSAARVDAAADRAMQRGGMPGLPSFLIAASCFLAAARVDEPACRGERFFNWDLATSRQFLAGLNAETHRQEIASGYEALFTARRPICPAVISYPVLEREAA